MLSKIDGLVIRKHKFQDRHLLVHLLLRNSQKISVVFYGGQGGGKKKKSSIIELGHLLKLELGKAGQGKMVHAKEWALGWSHEKLRYQHRAFYAMCFMIEVVDKLSHEADLHQLTKEEVGPGSGLFGILSNALYCMEQKLVSQQAIDHHNYLNTFLAKVLYDQGLFPDLQTCVMGGQSMGRESVHALSFEHGGFVSTECLGRDELQSHDKRKGQLLWDFLGLTTRKNFRETLEDQQAQAPFLKELFYYLCYQYNFNESDFKSLPLVV